MNLIDVHCHLDGDCYGDLEGLINSVLASGVKKLIVAGVDLNTGRFNKSLSEKYACCYYTVGFHPTELKTYREGDLEKIAALANCGKCVAIGEIGLDYHYPDTDKPLQRRIFEGQLKLAHELGLPVEIHSRNSAEDMFGILKAIDARPLVGLARGNPFPRLRGRYAVDYKGVQGVFNVRRANALLFALARNSRRAGKVRLLLLFRRHEYLFGQ